MANMANKVIEVFYGEAVDDGENSTRQETVEQRGTHNICCMQTSTSTYVLGASLEDTKDKLAMVSTAAQRRIETPSPSGETPTQTNNEAQILRRVSATE